MLYTFYIDLLIENRCLVSERERIGLTTVITITISRHCHDIVSQYILNPHRYKLENLKFAYIQDRKTLSQSY